MSTAFKIEKKNYYFLFKFSCLFSVRNAYEMEGEKIFSILLCNIYVKRILLRGIVCNMNYEKSNLFFL